MVFVDFSETLNKYVSGIFVRVSMVPQYTYLSYIMFEILIHETFLDERTYEEREQPAPFFAGPTRLELAASSVTDWRSNQN
jgi:hypothetical protein